MTRRRRDKPRRIALTLRLDEPTYAMLTAMSAGSVPRRTHQDILESALGDYLIAAARGPRRPRVRDARAMEQQPKTSTRWGAEQPV